MKKHFWIIIIVAAALVIIIGGFYLWRYYKNRQKVNNGPSTNQSSDSQTTPTSATSQTAPVPTIIYPIDNYSARLSKNSFGSYYFSQNSQKFDSTVCPGASEYTGYHTGDDLETIPAEQNIPIAVTSIATGTVRQVGRVSGYGGLAVIEYTLGDETYTAYFGHINLATTTLKVGSTVSIGEKIAELAPACSSANSNVRKHLHFSLHKGTGVDVEGYVNSKSALSAWIDPKALLSTLGAK